MLLIVTIIGKLSFRFPMLRFNLITMAVGSKQEEID